MAQISAAVLCDFAQVRENLLFVVSGGVSRVFSPKLPMSFSLSLALMIEIGPDEVDQAHELKVVVKNNDTAKDAGRINGAFQVGDSIRYPGEGLSVPMVMDLRPVGVDALGAHDVHTEVDGNIGPRLTCYFVEPPS